MRYQLQAAMAERHCTTGWPAKRHPSPPGRSHSADARPGQARTPETFLLSSSPAWTGVSENTAGHDLSHAKPTSRDLLRQARSLPGSETIKQRMDSGTPSPTSTWSAWAPVGAKKLPSRYWPTPHPWPCSQLSQEPRPRLCKNTTAHQGPSARSAQWRPASRTSLQMVGLDPLRAWARLRAVAPTQRAVASGGIGPPQSGGIGPPQADGPRKVVASGPLNVVASDPLRSGYPDL